MPSFFYLLCLRPLTCCSIPPVALFLSQFLKYAAFFLRFSFIHVPLLCASISLYLQCHVVCSVFHTASHSGASYVFVRRYVLLLSFCLVSPAICRVVCLLTCLSLFIFASLCSSGAVSTHGCAVLFVPLWLLHTFISDNCS